MCHVEINSSHPLILALIVPVVSQFYITEAENEYVIKGNSAIVKCKIPSFVTDFVSIESWIFDDGLVLYQNSTNETNYGTDKKYYIQS